MTLVVGVALYAVLGGGADTRAIAPLRAGVAVTQNGSTEHAASPEQRELPVQERSSASSALQVLPSISELNGVPAPQITSTAETRVETLNRNLKLPTATATALASVCQPSVSAAYCVYTVQEGDTLSSIAAAFNLDSEHLPGWELLVASNKPDLTSADDFILPGQKLRIPVQTGIVHTVILGETIGDLADMFDVSSASIIGVNGISDRNLIGIGQVLLIPDPRKIPAPASEASSAPSATPKPGETPEPEDEPTPEPSKGFIWPITAKVRITNYFGPRHPLGIDMGLSHAPGTPVVAVGAGKVVFAGGDACCSYGYYVIVDHENGLKTLYAHLRRIDVSVGQRVSQGQTLGPSGATGYATGVHLHFEVHKNGVRVDPLPYLP